MATFGVSVSNLEEAIWFGWRKGSIGSTVVFYDFLMAVSLDKHFSSADVAKNPWRAFGEVFLKVASGDHGSKKEQDETDSRTPDFDSDSNLISFSRHC